MEKFINITAFEIYLLNLINMEYINMENSFVDDDGNIYLNLDVELLPIPNINVYKPKGTGFICHTIKEFFEYLLERCIFDISSYYIVCDYTGKPVDIKGTNRLTESGLIGVFDRPNIISSIMEDMNIINHPDHDKYQKQLQQFKEAVKL